MKHPLFSMVITVPFHAAEFFAPHIAPMRILG